MYRNTTTQQRIFFWNAAGGVVYALSSFLMLLIVVRCCGNDEAGIFSIGNAISQLMITIGIFEATIFFATDAENRFSHEQYLANKLVTCALMIVVSLLYVSSFHFDPHKAAVAYALCAYRLLDALAQFWFGAFQKHNRLDVGGFSCVWRILLSLLAFAICVAITSDVVLACILATIIEIAWLALYDVPRLNKIIQIGKPDFSLGPLLKLLYACFPLFVASFLLAYLTNIPKYAIEAVGSNTMQTIFNVLFMPTFVINLFLVFFIKPSLTTLADNWLHNNKKSFMLTLTKLLIVSLIITIAVLLLSWIAGIPLLELFYGVDLTGETTSLLILMLGGGFLATANVFYNSLVVIRAQYTVVIGYGVAIIISKIAANPLVESLGVMGACEAYSISCAGLMVSFAILFAIGFSLKRPPTKPDGMSRITDEEIEIQAQIG